MQQGDYTASYYQYYQSNFQNPNPNSAPNTNDLYAISSPAPAAQASAPPISSSYTSSNFTPYSSTYPSDHIPNSSPTAPVYLANPNPQSSDPFPSPQLYSFPHLPSSQPASYFPYNQNQTFTNYDPSSHGHSYGPSSALPNYENPCANSGGVYFDDNSTRYTREYDQGGIYAYKGGKIEPSSPPRTEMAFDDYGRPIGLKEHVVSGSGSGSGPSSGIVRATPMVDTQEDVKSGVRKFRVTLLAESGSQSDMDVLCQIGLDGIRMLDLTTSRTLKIYPLEMLTRWEVLDSSIFAFWAKSSTDFDPRRIRLRSNSYTTNTILDIVTAATVQLKEMGGSNKPSDTNKVSDQLAEKKKAFSDWVNLMKPSNEEKDHWIPDEAVTKCTGCGTDFGAFVRKHYCRNCGDIFCDKCAQGRIALTVDEQAQPVRVCDPCLAKVIQRVSAAKEGTSNISGFQSHEVLAKKLQEEMERNQTKSSGLNKSDVSGMHMREVACPTSTVHLQVSGYAGGSGSATASDHHCSGYGRKKQKLNTGASRSTGHGRGYGGGERHSRPGRGGLGGPYVTPPKKLKEVMCMAYLWPYGEIRMRHIRDLYLLLHGLWLDVDGHNFIGHCGPYTFIDLAEYPILLYYFLCSEVKNVFGRPIEQHWRNQFKKHAFGLLDEMVYYETMFNLYSPIESWLEAGGIIPRFHPYKAEYFNWAIKRFTGCDVVVKCSKIDGRRYLARIRIFINVNGDYADPRGKRYVGCKRGYDVHYWDFYLTELGLYHDANPAV